MKKGLYLIFLLLSIIGSSTSFAAPSFKNTTEKIIVETKVPEGVVVKKNKVSLKSGYVYTRVSESKVTVMAKKKKNGAPGPISGEFTCGCQTNGSCRLVIDGTSIWCSVNTCGSSCQMTVSIPSGISVIQ